MATAISANKAELLAIADSVAREKLIDREIVIEAMEDAIQRAARARYGAENDIRAKIDPQSGDMRLWRVVEVVDQVDDYFKQVSVADAQKLQKGAVVGDYIVDPLPPIEFGRIAAQAAKQVIFQKVRDAERERQYEEFKDRIGEIITGVVKRVEFGHVVVDLGRAEGVIRRDAQIPREVVRVGDRIRSLILNVRRENRGPQIFLSRAHPDFMKKLFAQEVPEIYDGIIEIKAAARDPGSRAKIGVISHDGSIDPVGACVGMKGSRVQAVVQEMQGEKIDIIPWSPDLATFVVNALQPAQVARVVIDEEDSRIEVVVPDDQLSLAIGRRGQNVRLASQLTGSAIDIMTEADSSEKRQREFIERSEMFQTELDVDETLAQLLVAEGFGALEEVAYVDPAELSTIEGFDEELAGELQSRAQEALDRREAAARAERQALGVEDALAELPYLTEAMLVTLGKAGIKTLDDLADLATDELIQKKRAEPRRRAENANPRQEDKGGVLAEYGLSEEQGNEIIMAARAHWFEDEPAGEDANAEPPNDTVKPKAAGKPLPFKGGVGVGKSVEDTNSNGVTHLPTSSLEKEEEHVPIRKCILTGERAPRAGLIRLALGPDGTVAPDIAPRLLDVAHGSVLTAPPLELAIAKGKLKGALSRAFKTTVEISADLPEKIEQALARASLDRLGLEAKSGTLLTGTEKIGEAARKGTVALMLHASDAAADGTRKLDQALRVGLGVENSGYRGLVIPASRAILSMALGRENVVHIALIAPAAAARVSESLARWRGFIGRDSDAGPCEVTSQGQSA